MQVRLSFHCTCEKPVDVKYKILNFSLKRNDRRFEYRLSWSHSCGRLLWRKGQVSGTARMCWGDRSTNWSLQGMNPQIWADGVVKRCNTFQSHVISVIAWHGYCFMWERALYTDKGKKLLLAVKVWETVLYVTPIKSAYKLAGLHLNYKTAALQEAKGPTEHTWRWLCLLKGVCAILFSTACLCLHLKTTVVSHTTEYVCVCWRSPITTGSHDTSKE